MDEHNNDETTQVLQTVVDPRLGKLLAGLQQQVDAETVPSGILLRTNVWNSKLDKRNGTEHSPVIKQMEWLNMFSILTGSTIFEKDAESVDVMTEAEPFWANGVVPIYIADFTYERLRPRWFAHVKRTVEAPADESVRIPALSKVISQQHTFFASVLLQPDYDHFTQIAGKHYGKKVKFVIPASAYKTNTGRLIESVDLSFGDGTLLQQICPDQIIEHEFARYGTQKITLSLHILDGDTRIAKFSFEVAAPAPAPNATWHFKDTNGEDAATAWVFYGGSSGRTRIEKPVLLAEGFPGGRTLDKLWPLVNQSDFVPELRRAGRDFIILGFTNGTRKIQENAVFYEACIKKIITEKQNNEKIAAGGGSMGGLIARYALCKMEKDGFDHHANVYFTVDTPHEGANIPVSAQAFIQLYVKDNCGKLSKDVRESAALMQSDAAQQMLLQWIFPYEQWDPNRWYPTASPKRKEFLDALDAVGWMPKKVWRIGVADGVGNGVGNGVPPGAQTVYWPYSIFNGAAMWSSVEDRGLIIDVTGTIGRNTETWKLRRGGQRIDGAPGGTSNTWGKIYVGMPWARGSSCAHPNHCFVSTTSACAIKSNDLYANINSGQYPSDLHAYKVSSTKNLEHVALTPELKTFLVENIRNSPQAPNLEAWALNMPVAGSRGWVPGYGVRYAVAYEFKDGSEYWGAWWSPTTGGRAPDKDGYNGDDAYACAMLKDIPCDPTNKAVARRIYRQFRSQPQNIRMVGRIPDNRTTTWMDTDRDIP